MDPAGANGGTPVLASVSEEGELVGAVFRGGFRGLWAAPDPEAPSPCPEDVTPPDPIVEALQAGVPAIIHGIHFDLDSDRLRPDAVPALERVLSALRATGDQAVVIEGHTDSTGAEDHNLDLSQRRAQTVVAWLVERGVDAARLTPVGKGETEPIADNESSAGRTLNRRVEVQPG